MLSVDQRAFTEGVCCPISAGMTFSEAVLRFNSNVSYSGLLHAVTADVSTSLILAPRVDLVTILLAAGF